MNTSCLHTHTHIKKHRHSKEHARPSQQHYNCPQSLFSIKQRTTQKRPTETKKRCAHDCRRQRVLHTRMLVRSASTNQIIQYEFPLLPLPLPFLPPLPPSPLPLPLHPRSPLNAMRNTPPIQTSPPPAPPPVNNILTRAPPTQR
jgi:hypothetical protein